MQYTRQAKFSSDRNSLHRKNEVACMFIEVVAYGKKMKHVRDGKIVLRQIHEDVHFVELRMSEGQSKFHDAGLYSPSPDAEMLPLSTSGTWQIIFPVAFCAKGSLNSWNKWRNKKKKPLHCPYQS